MDGNFPKPRSSCMPPPVFLLAGAALSTLIVYIGVSTRLEGVPQLPGSTLFYPETVVVNSQNKNYAEYGQYGAKDLMSAQASSGYAGGEKMGDSSGLAAGTVTSLVFESANPTSGPLPATSTQMAIAPPEGNTRGTASTNSGGVQVSSSANASAQAKVQPTASVAPKEPSQEDRPTNNVPQPATTSLAIQSSAPVETSAAVNRTPGEDQTSQLHEGVKGSDGEEDEAPAFSVKGYPFELQSDFPRLSGALMPMVTLGQSHFFCEHETCVIENACVDHAKVIKGATHLFTMDTSNWFISILKAFSLRRVMDIYTGRDQPFNMVLSHKPGFGVDLRKPFLQPYRAIHPTYAPLYDLRESLHGGESNITCFERAIVGCEYRGQMLTGFNRQHLDNIIPSMIEKVLGGDKYPPSLRAYAIRLLEINSTLANDLTEFKRIMLRRFGKEHVAMEPKTALLVARKAERKSTGLPPYRQLLNLDALVSVLESEGYNVTVAEFTGMSVPEQMEISRRTSLFIAMHGAGMANIMWLHRQAVVLELHTYGFQKWGYETFAAYLGQPYVGWVNQNIDNTKTTWHSEKFPRDNPNFWRSRDQIVDVKEFTKAVRRGQALSERMTLHQSEVEIRPSVPPLDKNNAAKKLWARKGIYGGV